MQAMMHGIISLQMQSTGGKLATATFVLGGSRKAHMQALRHGLVLLQTQATGGGATNVYALLGEECGDVAVEDGRPEDVDGAAGAGAGGQELDVDGLVDGVAVVEAGLVEHLGAPLQELPPEILWHCRAALLSRTCTLRK